MHAMVADLGCTGAALDIAQFDKAAVKQWRRTVSKELHRLSIASDSPEFAPGRILCAVYGFGTDVPTIAEVTGYEPKVVREVLKRCRKARLIVGQTLRVAWNQKTGGFAVMLDAMVASGELGRYPDDKRSAAQKARKPSPSRVQRRPRVRMMGAFAPKVVNSDPLYQLADWKPVRSQGDGGPSR